jgi:transposase InsO family protein
MAIALGTPMQNGYIESFNSRMRDELLNESRSSISIRLGKSSLFASPTYNTTRPAANAGHLIAIGHRVFQCG